MAVAGDVHAMSLNAEDRRKYIEMACRLAKPGSGSSRDMLRERRTDYGTVDIRKFMGSVPFVIVGGLATRLYMPERTTLDMDVLVAPAGLEEP